MELKYHSIPSRAESDNPIDRACELVSTCASQIKKLHFSCQLLSAVQPSSEPLVATDLAEEATGQGKRGCVLGYHESLTMG